MNGSRFIWAAVLYTAAVIGASFLPGSSVPPGFPHMDKVIHALAFAAMGLLVGLAFRRRAFLIDLVWIGLAGTLSEALQWFTPGRTVSAADLASDVIGGLTGFCAVRLLIHWLRARPSPPPGPGGMGVAL
ncbi:MAG: VanZ family protein [Planctomycetota bacterium]